MKTTNKLLLVIALFFYSFSVSSQTRNCGTMEHLEFLKSQDPTLEERMQNNENSLQQRIQNQPENSSFTIITIPVVVHVVYNNSTENISTAQIQSQIDILNEDFRRLNADASNTPSAFQSVAADCEIEFCLASSDPNGNSTTGITRTFTSQSSFTDVNDPVKYSSSGGTNAWNTSAYLNIWVCDLVGGLLGYAQFPGGPASSDGVVCDYAYFGNTGTTSSYNLGRTATHEVGHYLNLSHIWGDSYCGNDFCNDTPTQQTDNFACPSFPHITCSNSPNGDMFMNYMDYTYDACMNLFTNDQKTRMITAINTFRSGLITSNGCQGPCTLDVITLNLYDSYGDGWNGNTLTVNGVDYTFATGSSASFTLCVDLSICNTATYNATGSWTSENSWDITDASGTVLLSGGNVGSGGDFGTCCSVVGCTDATACNYDATACLDDGSCIFPDGCTDPLATNYNAAATCDDGSCFYGMPGCTDPTACNYNSAATIDDGSCEWTSCSGVCAEDAPTGLYASNVLQNRATINWDNMNDANCMVDQYRISYSDDGGATWTTKTMGQPVNSCLWAANNTDKLILNLIPSTTYTYRMKAWYCGDGNSAWSANETFTTEDDCPNVGNLTVTAGSPTQATFTWNGSNGAYSFMRIKARVDVTGSTWFNVGGSGVSYGIFTKNKNGLSPGTSYRGQSRTWCSPNGGAWKSPTWTPLMYWTQPTIRLEGGTTIANLAIYPNPSRDIFNVSFTSEDVQDLKVRVINVIGEELISDNLEQFIGEYTKAIDLVTYTKGIYFLEITTNNGVVNKKLILQ